LELKLKVIDDLTLEMVEKLSEFKTLFTLSVTFQANFDVEAIRDV